MAATLKGMPPTIDRLLTALGRQAELSPMTAASITSIGRSVVRAFSESPVDRSSLLRALEKVQKCLPDGGAPGSADVAAAIDPRVVPDLMGLAREIEAELLHDRGPGPAEPIPGPDTVPRPHSTLLMVAPPPPAEDVTTSSARQASSRLARLLRRRGTSADVGKLLRSAVNHLDQVFAHVDLASRREALDAAIRSLRECLALIAISPRPADAEQRQGAAEALELLRSIVPDEPDRAHSYPIAASPDVGPHQAAEASPEYSTRRSSPRQPPADARPPAALAAENDDDTVSTARAARRDRNVVSALISKLGSLYSRRTLLLADHCSRWRDLRTADDQIANVAFAIEWLAQAVVEDLATEVMNENTPPDIFASALAFLCARKVDPILSQLAREEAPGLPGTPAVFAALRMCPLNRWSSDLATSLLSSPNRLSAGLLRVLAGRGGVTRDHLTRVLDDADTAVASPAAELLAWLGHPSTDALALEDRAHRSGDEHFRCSALFAAVVLGSGRAIVKLRQMFDRAALVDERAIDALVVGGGPDDVRRLLELSVREPELAELAVLGAGHLGHSAIETAIATTNVSEEVKRDAVRATLGEGPRPRAAPDPRRLLRGEPWTVGGALARLNAPDEILPRRRWYALEIIARSGIHPGVVFDACGPSREQIVAANHLRASIEAARTRLPGGKWAFAGQAIA